MARDERKLSIIVLPDWGPPTRTIQVTWRRARLIMMLGAFFAAAFAVVTVTWISMARRAAISDDLRIERDALLARRDSMSILAERLAGLEARETQLRVLSGLEGSRDSELWRSGAPRTGASAASPTADDAETEPTMWPLTERGFVTQSLLDGDAGDHPGIDIAIPSGSYVRAAGGGEVIEAAQDPVYGLFVLIDHGNGVWTRYGHAVYLAVERGQSVKRGEVIALSGSTGRSTAPHLHFEITRNGRAVDPMTMVTPP